MSSLKNFMFGVDEAELLCKYGRNFRGYGYFIPVYIYGKNVYAFISSYLVDDSYHYPKVFDNTAYYKLNDDAIKIIESMEILNKI